MNEPAASYWCELPDEFVDLLQRASGNEIAPSFLFIEKLEVAVLSGLSAFTVTEVIRTLGWVEGWFVRLSPGGSDVATVDVKTRASFQGDFACPNGEALDADGTAYRVAPTGAGDLAIWAYRKPVKNDFHGRSWPPQGFTALPDLNGLLVERRVYGAVRETLESVSYDVYWAATKDDGVQPRLALFAGFDWEISGE